MNALGLVTIGQAPRVDMRSEIGAQLGTEVQILEAGALDELERDAIDALAPKPGHTALVTRLRDGNEVHLDEGAITSLLEGAIARVEKAGADIVLVVCTGRLPRLQHHRPLLMAGPLLTAATAGVAVALRVGVLCPAASQHDEVRQKWRAAGVRLADVWVASPYLQSGSDVERIVADVRGIDVLVMDCMGYTEAMASRIREGAGVRTLLARRVVTRMAGLLLA